MAKLNFNIKMTLFDDEIQKAFDTLENVGKRATRQIMSEMRIKGIEHAQELLDRLIYFTDARGRPRYNRTGTLRGAVQGFVRNQSGVATLYMFASGAPYALYNELGTFGSRMTQDEIIELARRAMHDDARILILEFERGAKTGLEPRPFMYPTMVWLEVQLEKAFREYLKGAGFSI